MSHGIVYLDCSSASHYCPNETLILTCKTTGCLLEWSANTSDLEIDFVCGNHIGSAESSNIYFANLTGRNQAEYALTSDLRFKAILSLTGQSYYCLDGFDADRRSCTLTPMSKL